MVFRVFCVHYVFCTEGNSNTKRSYNLFLGIEMVPQNDESHFERQFLRLMGTFRGAQQHLFLFFEHIFFPAEMKKSPWWFRFQAHFDSWQEKTAIKKTAKWRKFIWNRKCHHHLCFIFPLLQFCCWKEYSSHIKTFSGAIVNEDMKRKWHQKIQYHAFSTSSVDILENTHHFLVKKYQAA